MAWRPAAGALALLACAVPGGARQAANAPLRAATPREQAQRIAVSQARYRYDDLLWENDRIGFRIYGRALEAAEPPSGSGIDAWGKRARWPFMERQLRTGDQHRDHGEGLDFYNVGTGRGIGGLGIWHDNKLWVSRNYGAHRILSAGPEAAVFEVDYRPWPVDTVRTVRETRRFTLEGGTNFTRMESRITSGTRAPLIVGIGIGKRTGASMRLGEVTRDAARARLTWWGPEEPGKGRMAGAILVDPAAFAGFAEDADNYLVLVRVTPGRPFLYYAGAAWSEGPDFRSRAAWQAYVDAQRPDFGRR